MVTTPQVKGVLLDLTHLNEARADPLDRRNAVITHRKPTHSVEVFDAASVMQIRGLADAESQVADAIARSNYNLGGAKWCGRRRRDG